MSVAVIIFSKDRAMQLDALLSSIKESLTLDPLGSRPTVLYTASNDEFQRGYSQIIRDHGYEWCDMIPERDFQRDFEALLPDAGYLCTFVDDDVCHGRANLSHAAYELDITDELAAFSLRLGGHTTHCYPLDAAQELPRSTWVTTNSMLRWRWVGAEHDFGYPFSLDGHVLRVDDVRAMLHASAYNNPNQLEQTLASRAWMRSSVRPKMACYARSVVTGIPANRVNTTHPNRCMDGYDPAWLNDAYLDGVRINWKRMDWDAVDAAHAEIPYVFTPAPIADAA